MTTDINLLPSLQALFKRSCESVSEKVQDYVSTIISSSLKKMPTDEEHLIAISSYINDDPHLFLFGMKLIEPFIFTQLNKINKRFSQELTSSLDLALRTRDFDKITLIINWLCADCKDRNSVMKRCYFTQNLSWAIPTIDAIKSIVQFAESDQILEICSGLCLWARLIKECDGNIIATDSFAYQQTSQTSQITPFIDSVYKMDAVTAVKTFKTNVLLICWPNYNDSYAYDALSIFKGNKLVYIGEYGGCTADEQFHNLLEQKWRCVNEIDIPTWQGIYDCIYMYERITPIDIVEQIDTAEQVKLYNEYAAKSEYVGDWVEIKKKKR